MKIFFNNIFNTYLNIVTHIKNIHNFQALQEQLAKKGQEINEYIEKHDIKVQRGAENANEAPQDNAPAKTNVLVASG